MRKIIITALLFALLISYPIWQTYVSSKGPELSVAVASNFLSTLEALTKNFEKETGVKVRLSSGSSGKLTTQIIQGAPYDMFFSADVVHPKKLEESRLTIKGSRLTYAIGQLVVWAPNNTYATSVENLFTNGNYDFIAIANPDLAPYGVAAQEFLQHLNLWGRLSNKIIKGENINQTFQFVKSGNAQIGIIAFSQVKQMNADPQDNIHFFIVDTSLYNPIEQQVVLLSGSKKKALAKMFLSFIQEDNNRKLIENSGYITPHKRIIQVH